jgi:hypothetical protein
MCEPDGHRPEAARRALRKANTTAPEIVFGSPGAPSRLVGLIGNTRNIVAHKPRTRASIAMRGFVNGLFIVR